MIPGSTYPNTSQGINYDGGNYDIYNSQTQSGYVTNISLPPQPQPVPNYVNYSGNFYDPNSNVIAYNASAESYGSGIMGPQVRPKPAVQLLREGSGISHHEQQAIIGTSMAVYQSGMTPISNNTASRIKKALGGDWLVIVYEQGKPEDFNMTCVQGNDYIYFTLNNLAYQVCRLR